jgi:hypothetical protein
MDEFGDPWPSSLSGWAAWIAENPDANLIGDTTIDGIRVRTIFVGQPLASVEAHSEWDAPLLFETTVSGGYRDGYKWHARTISEARSNHRMAIFDVGWGVFWYYFCWLMSMPVLVTFGYYFGKMWGNL